MSSQITFLRSVRGWPNCDVWFLTSPSFLPIWLCREGMISLCRLTSCSTCYFIRSTTSKLHHAYITMSQTLHHFHVGPYTSQDYLNHAIRIVIIPNNFLGVQEPYTAYQQLSFNHSPSQTYLGFHLDRSCVLILLKTTRKVGLLTTNLVLNNPW